MFSGPLFFDRHYHFLSDIQSGHADIQEALAQHGARRADPSVLEMVMLQHGGQAQETGPCAYINTECRYVDERDAVYRHVFGDSISMRSAFAVVINLLAVDKPAQRNGLGRQLMAHAYAYYADQLGDQRECTELIGFVLEADLASRRYYEHLGFSCLQSNGRRNCMALSFGEENITNIRSWQFPPAPDRPGDAVPHHSRTALRRGVHA